MNEITEISPQKKDKRRCNVYVDGRFCCGLTLETAVKNRLKVGQIVSPDRLAQMQLESEKETAFDKALTHISATMKTEKEIADFLAKKGYLPAVIEYVLEKLRSYNFLNDREYAETYARSVSKRKGGRLIKMELRFKGIDEESIENALDGLDALDELQTAKEILTKYMRGKTADIPTLQKAYRHLMTKGFSYDTVKEALSAYGLEEE